MCQISSPTAFRGKSPPLKEKKNNASKKAKKRREGKSEENGAEERREDRHKDRGIKKIKKEFYQIKSENRSG